MSFFVFLWKMIALFLYAILKAFLPLPSLEVVLIPLLIDDSSYWLLYSFIGSIGTFFGGGIGYALASHQGRTVLVHLINEESIKKGEDLMNKYGLLTVFIGGITPIPDFLLAYLAGFSKMPFFQFALCDAIARFLRSILVSWSIIVFGSMIDIDLYGTWLSTLIIAYFVLRWLYSKGKETYTKNRKKE